MVAFNTLKHSGHVGVISLKLAGQVVKIHHAEAALPPIELDQGQRYFGTQGQLVKTTSPTWSETARALWGQGQKPGRYDMMDVLGL